MGDRPDDPHVRRRGRPARRGSPADRAVRVLRGDGPPIRIGHRGAAALAPENTLEALRAGIAEGCDYVEFDVLSNADGGLVLAHSAHELPEDVASLDDALALLAAEGVGAHVDLKERGLEEAVGER